MKSETDIKKEISAYLDSLGERCWHVASCGGVGDETGTTVLLLPGEGVPVLPRRMTMVPLKDRPELAELLRQAIARFEAMTPEQQEEHRRAQRESWVRGEMGLGLDDKR